MSSSFSENWVAVPESEFQITEDNIEVGALCGWCGN